MSSTKQDVLGPQTVWVSPSSPAILVKQHKVLYGWVKWNVDEKVWWLINTADHITTLIVLKQLSQSQWGLTETAQQKTSRLFQKITMLSVWCRAARCEHTAAQICSQRQRGGVLQIIATKIIQSDIKKMFAEVVYMIASICHCFSHTGIHHPCYIELVKKTLSHASIVNKDSYLCLCVRLFK